MFHSERPIKNFNSCFLKLEYAKKDLANVKLAARRTSLMQTKQNELCCIIKIFSNKQDDKKHKIQIYIKININGNSILR